jgi:predicted SnoaL-like aldol condensation-catalyzing enzyme
MRTFTLSATGRILSLVQSCVMARLSANDVFYAFRRSTASAKLNNAVGLYTEGIRDGHAAVALEKYIGNRYTQHSTGVADGKEGFLAFFIPFLAAHPDRDIRIVRAFEDGQYVFVQAHQILDGGVTQWITTDLFDTDADDRIVEHWDVISAFTGPNPSGHTQVDGSTEIGDLELTEANKAAIAKYARVVLQGGDFRRIAYFVSATVVQHSPRVADGLTAFKQFREGLAAAGKSFAYRDAHRIVGSGNFVVTYSLVEIGSDELAVFDVFRLKNGLIVEHWDNMEPIPSPEQARNSGKF